MLEWHIRRERGKRERGGCRWEGEGFCCCCCCFFIFVFCLFVCLFVCHYHDSGYRRVTKPFFILVLVFFFPLIILLDRKVTSQELSYTYHEIVSNLKKKKKKKRETQKATCGGRGGESHREREREIRMIYAFRPLPLMNGCRRMTYHLTVHTIIIPMSKKTIKLMTVYLTRY